MSIEAMKQALEWIEAQPDPRMITAGAVCTALRQAIEQAEKQEPQFKYTPYGLRADESGNLSIGELPRKEWVGLTYEEIKELLDCGRGGLVDIKKAEQMLKEKNT